MSLYDRSMEPTLVPSLPCAFLQPIPLGPLQEMPAMHQLWEIPTASSFSGISYYGKQEHWEVLVSISLLQAGVCRHRVEPWAGYPWGGPTETISSSTLRRGAGGKELQGDSSTSPVAVCRLVRHLQLSQKTLGKGCRARPEELWHALETEKARTSKRSCRAQRRWSSWQPA